MFNKTLAVLAIIVLIPVAVLSSLLAVSLRWTLRNLAKTFAGLSEAYDKSSHRYYKFLMRTCKKVEDLYERE